MSHRLRYLYRVYRYRYRVDRAEIRFMCERLRAGETAVDVGCFKGAYTYWMRRCVGAGGEVIAFEPQPQQVAYLRGVVDAMKWQNVVIEGQGMSDAPGELSLFRPASGHEASFVTRDSNASNCETIRVPVTTLDAYFANRAALPAMIKIDVEGFESAVLAGARETLERGRPTLLVECETRHRADGDVRPVLDFLAALGYEGSFFLEGKRLPVAEFDPLRHQRLDSGGKIPRTYANNFAFEHPTRRK